MSTRANYYKIGIFVLAGTIIAVAGVIVLGAGALFRETILMETYIDESVQGLDVGSPVKYRGVQIGNVKRITFANGEYDTEKPYIMVVIDLFPDAFGRQTESVIRARLEKEIERGLRVRLAQQGLTGAAYLEANYFDAERYPTLEIDWEPTGYYIPSAPSMIKRVTDSMDEVFRRLEKTPIEQVVVDLDTFLVTLTEAVKEAKVKTVREETVGLLDSLRQSSDRLREILNKPEIDSIPADAAAAAKSARRLTESAAADVEEVFAEADNILADVRAASSRMGDIAKQLETLLGDERIDRGLEEWSGFSRNLRETSEHLPETAKRVNRTLRDTERLLSKHQSDIREILDNLKRVTENLKAVTNDAKEYPSHFLFGDPPQPSEVMK